MLLNPMIVMVFGIFALGISNFVVRYRAIKNKQLKISHFRTYESKEGSIPEQVVIFGRHFDNQFQVPVIFLITCVAAQTMPLYSTGYLRPLARGPLCFLEPCIALFIWGLIMSVIECWLIRLAGYVCLPCGRTWAC